MNAPNRSSSRSSSSSLWSALAAFLATIVVGGVVVYLLYPDEFRTTVSNSPLGDMVEGLPQPGFDPHDGRGHYLDAVSPRDEGVRDLAVEVTRKCKTGDRGCEASRLLRHVASKIKYVSDPRGEGDYVQPPMRTVELGAGDCEDQTILLASMFEAVGIRTLLAFTDNHVYPMACTEEPLKKRHLGSGAKVYVIDGGALHCYPAEPTNPKAKLGQEGDHEGFLLVADPVDGSVHDFAQAPKPE